MYGSIREETLECIQHFEKSRLKEDTINLSFKLERIPRDLFKGLFLAIQNSNLVKKLDLSWNEFTKLSDEEFSAVCDTIKNSQSIIEFDLHDTDLGQLTSERKRELFMAFRENKIFQIIRLESTEWDEKFADLVSLYSKNNSYTQAISYLSDKDRRGVHEMCDYPKTFFTQMQKNFDEKIPEEEHLNKVKTELRNVEHCIFYDELDLLGEDFLEQEMTSIKKSGPI